MGSPRRILYVQFNNPAALPPLEHSSRILADCGWKVLFLGAGQQSADALRFPPHPNIEVRMLQHCPPGWRQKVHFLKFCLWVFWCAARWQPQWIYASDMMAAPAAWVIGFVGRWKVIYHEHDSPIPNDRTDYSAFFRMTLSSRARLARRADLCVVPNQGRAAALVESTGTKRPVLSVWNCPKRAEADLLPHPVARGTGFVLFYHGSIVPARIPIEMVQALARLPEEIVLRIAGYETVGSRGYVESLKAEAARLGIGKRLQYLGPVPQRADLLIECRRAAVGISLMPVGSNDRNEQTMAGASNKAFDYLACGLPVLVSELQEWEELFVRPGFGRACNPSDAGSIAEAVRWFFENGGEARRMGERGRERIRAEWNYETQFQPVLNAIIKSMDHPVS